MATQAPSSDSNDDHDSDHGGRRTRIAELLREANRPLPVEEVAEQVGVHINTARFHLEALVDAGQARRENETRGKPGRRRVLYAAAQANHESAQSYQLLVTMLTTVIAMHCPDAEGLMYRAGLEWGHFLTTRPMPFEVVSEDDIAARLVDKLDELWFAVELSSEPEPRLLLHNCPFLDAAQQTPRVICQLHAGMINGSLAELRSKLRIVELVPQVEPYLCCAYLSSTADDLTHVQLNLSGIPSS